MSLRLPCRACSGIGGRMSGPIQALPEGRCPMTNAEAQRRTTGRDRGPGGRWAAAAATLGASRCGQSLPQWPRPDCQIGIGSATDCANRDRTPAVLTTLFETRQPTLAPEPLAPSLSGATAPPGPPGWGQPTTAPTRPPGLRKSAGASQIAWAVFSQITQSVASAAHDAFPNNPSRRKRGGEPGGAASPLAGR